MGITVKFFASLRERLGQGESVTPYQPGDTAGLVWARVTGEPSPPAHILVAVNSEYRDMTTGINDGDEVAFFPPVTGG